MGVRQQQMAHSTSVWHCGSHVATPYGSSEHPLFKLKVRNPSIIKTVQTFFLFFKIYNFLIPSWNKDRVLSLDRLWLSPVESFQSWSKDSDQWIERVISHIDYKIYRPIVTFSLISIEIMVSLKNIFENTLTFKDIVGYNWNVKSRAF